MPINIHFRRCGWGGTFHFRCLGPSWNASSLTPTNVWPQMQTNNHQQPKPNTKIAPLRKAPICRQSCCFPAVCCFTHNKLTQHAQPQKHKATTAPWFTFRGYDRLIHRRVVVEECFIHRIPEAYTNKHRYTAMHTPEHVNKSIVPCVCVCGRLKDARESQSRWPEKIKHHLPTHTETHTYTQTDTHTHPGMQDGPEVIH